MAWGINAEGAEGAEDRGVSAGGSSGISGEAYWRMPQGAVVPGDQEQQTTALPSGEQRAFGRRPLAIDGELEEPSGEF